MAEVINGILIREVETKNIMTKSSLPVGGYSVNPYVGCTHACKYCYRQIRKEKEELLIAKRTAETILNIDRQKEQEKEQEKEEKKNFR